MSNEPDCAEHRDYGAAQNKRAIDAEAERDQLQNALRTSRQECARMAEQVIRQNLAIPFREKLIEEVVHAIRGER